jgi:signal transduction histidine kinase/ActR/RegA family two-component response regulator
MKKPHGRPGMETREGTPNQPVAATETVQQEDAEKATAKIGARMPAPGPSNRLLKWWTRALSPRLVTPMSLAAICLLVAVAALANWFAEEQSNQAQWVRHTLAVERDIATLTSSIHDAESGERGFLITGQESYLESYRAALPRIATEQQLLRTVTADNPRQIRTLAALDGAIAEDLSNLANTVSLMQTYGHDEAAKAVRAGRSEATMERLRTFAATMSSEEEGLLAERTREMERAELQFRAAVVGFLFLIVVLAALILTSLQMYRTQLIAARDTLATKNSELRSEIDSRLAAEAQTFQMQKMEAIGQLAGGIAHDFNNMLAVIGGAVGLIQLRLARGERNVDSLAQSAIETVHRAAALTGRLLAFSRQQPLNAETQDVNRLVGGMSEILHQTLGTQINIETVLGAGLWSVHADASQLENAVLNMAVNARDAMGEGGRLTIETANTSLDDAYVRSEVGVPAGQYVMIAISDTGSGMTPEVISKAFDPFFTTKAIGTGTGLGLSQTYGFVKQSGGHIKIYSEEGRGSVIKIYLPRITDNTTRAVTAKETVLARGDLSKVILVVDDEADVREITTNILRELGYTVIHAARPSEALSKLRANPNIDLMFTDIMMPEMNGDSLAVEAIRENPGLKVLFASGYAQNAFARDGVHDAHQDFLMKPFSVEHLATKVANVLARAA